MSLGPRWLAGVLATLGLAVCSAQPLSLRTVSQAGARIKYEPDEAGVPRGGICLDILHAVQRVDPGLRFPGVEQPHPLRRVELLLEEGGIDVFFCLLRSPERAQRWQYGPTPLYGVRHAVVLRAEMALDLDGYEALAQLSRQQPVVVMRGSILVQALKREGVAVAEVASDREALEMLLRGRASAVYGQEQNLQQAIRDAQLGARVRLQSQGFPLEYQFLVYRKDLPQAAVDRLNAALKRLEADGSLRRIAEAYR